MSLSTIFLGHQSWLVSLGETSILVDPILTPSFGTSLNLRFFVYPPRNIDFNKMPRISAVVITNEHLDHFHLDSLKLIPREVPIIFGDLMPEVCIEFARILGHKIHIISINETFQIGELVVQLFLGAEDSEFWEKRVYHAYIQPCSGSRGIFIQSDALLSRRFKELVEADIIAPPLVFIATNNAQIVPDGFKGTYDNLLISETSINQDCFGVEMLSQVLSTYLHGLPFVPHILLSGGGYIQNPLKHGPFLFSDISELANLANELSLYQKIHGLVPGQAIEFIDQNQFIVSDSNWINIDQNHWSQLLSFSSNEAEILNLNWMNMPIFSEDENESIDEKLIMIEEFLEKMAPCLMMSKLGASINAVDEYISGPLGADRFIFHFLRPSGHSPIQYALNFNNCTFEKLQIPCVDPLKFFPFGVEVYLSDFWSLLNGKIQIWELATGRMRQWYLSDHPLLSPVGFLYCFFSEQVQTDLARKMYSYICARDIVASSETKFVGLK
jgi:hypothetical protein